MVNVSGVFKGSTIDHMYTNVEHLFTTPEVIHLVTVIMMVPFVQTITRRHLPDNDVNSQVLQENTLDGAD